MGLNESLLKWFSSGANSGICPEGLNIFYSFLLGWGSATVWGQKNPETQNFSDKGEGGAELHSPPLYSSGSVS